MAHEVVYISGPYHEGMRLDLFLVDMMHAITRTRVQKIIRMGRVQVNNETRRASYMMQQGDRVVILHEDLRDVHVDQRPLPVLFEDACLVAVNKPPHMLSHPVGRNIGGTVVERIQERFPKEQQDEVRLCNRLDKETSGVMLVALDKNTRQLMQTVFEERRVAKVYLALVRGCPEPGQGEIDLPIGQHPTAPIRIKQAVHGENARPCKTAYRVVKQAGELSLVELTPHTGRQHQLRVHMDHIGCPIVGDRLYGTPKEPTQWPPRDFPKDAPITRHALHAWKLTFAHPHTGMEISLQAPLPQDMAALLE